MIHIIAAILITLATPLVSSGQQPQRESLQILPDSPYTLGLSGRSTWSFAQPPTVAPPLRTRLEGSDVYVLERIDKKATNGGLTETETVTELARVEIFDDGVSVYVTWYPTLAYRKSTEPAPDITLNCANPQRTLILQPIRERVREPESVVFVLDASGSMAGTKLQSAKQALAAAARALPKSSEAALVVLYDCNQVRRDCDFTKDVGTLIEKAEAVNATGGTPLGDAMDAAYKYLHASASNPETRRRIVVLSDGLASCGADPGSVAGGWGAGDGSGGPRVAIIGLELGEGESQILRALAKRANGKYIDATEKTVEAAMLRATGAARDDAENGK